MDGILLVNKRIGWTSRDVVNKIMRIFRTKKVGHTGTLDPFASGLLIITINKGTKISSYLEGLDKSYIAEVCLGKSTDTLDLTGNVIEEKEVNLPIDKAALNNALLSFIGDIKQVPPMYSAIKIDGEELYKKARRGEVVERKERDVHISSIDILSIVDNTFTMKVDCSKGTYIRSLCVDVCEKLGYPGLMNSLVRTKTGVWNLEESSTIEDIELGNFKAYSMLEAVKNLPLIEDEDCVYKAFHGMKISPSKIYDILCENPQRIAIKEDDKLVAIYDFDKEIKGYRAVRVWN